MNRILNIYERSALPYFLKNDLRRWLFLFMPVSIMLGCASIISKSIWLSVIALIVLFMFLMMMFRRINDWLSMRYPLRNSGLRIGHYSLLEKRLYWTMPRFSKFYSELRDAFNDKEELLTLIRDTKNYFREVIGVFDNREKIIETPRRQLRLWFYGIAITAIMGLTYKVIEKLPLKILISVLAGEFVFFYVIFMAYGLFFDKYYQRQYKIIELYNFLLCAETIINYESDTE